MGTEAIPENNHANNPSDHELQIIRQIEYYFGNFNLSRDKFLRDQIKIDDGWVPLETMIKFNRLKKLTEDFNVISEALKKSPNQLMEVSEDCQKIRRRVSEPVPDYKEKKEELDEKTLYMKGFKKTSTLDDILDFFKEYKVENVFMRKDMKKKFKPFKGSVFVTFETKEDAENFLQTKGIKYSGTELLKERKKDYFKRKDEEYRQRKEAKEMKKLKKTENEEGKTENVEGKTENRTYISGSLLKLSNLDENCTREIIREAFEPHGLLAFIDYSKGQPNAVLRFESGIANSIFEKLIEEDGRRIIKLGSCTATVFSVAEEEEKEYWNTIAKSKAQTFSKYKNKKGSGYQGGKYKKWGKQQKRKQDENDEKREPAHKKKKEDIPTADETAAENSKILESSEENGEMKSKDDVQNQSEKNVQNQSEENVQNQSEKNSHNKSEEKMSETNENKSVDMNTSTKVETTES